MINSRQKGENRRVVRKNPWGGLRRSDIRRGPHGYADMNISMDISMNITDMNTMFSSWIISMDMNTDMPPISMNIHGYRMSVPR